VVIELKSSRVNEVKKQANNFKKEIELQKDFFRELTFLMTNREWNGKVRCIIVWPKVESIARKNPEEYKEVEEYQYSKKGEGFIIKNANSCK
ncbi:hypothetical protein LJC62_04330, partial [Odoribacter sp. OttesenSCG-928-A06]|nr:hypothetical protein [Odoribacter sp. OttesenSCG-928-A06]